MGLFRFAPSVAALVSAFAGMTNNGMCLWSCAPLFGVLSFTRRAKKTKFQDGTKKRAVLYVYSFYDDCTNDKKRE